ncbi:MAG: hypothetical protein R3D88_07170 [Alphaproteobacteria bacterium]|nr:hypothetical protein [Alphaproteobacteria bacterium]
MSIITDNKITRSTSFLRKNGLRVAFLLAVGSCSGIAYNNVKPLDACEAATLDLKNADRIAVSTEEAQTYKDGRIKVATTYLEQNCPSQP